MVRHLKKCFEVEGVEDNNTRLQTLQLPASALISVYQAPSLNNKMIDFFVIVFVTGRRLLQRIVATDSYYVLENGRFNTFMVESDNAIKAADAGDTE